MTSVFIGGSRAVSRLNEIIRDKIDDLIDRQCMIFVGDANGADKAVQQHLASRGYGHVTVYCMEQCRNNLGNWPAKHVATPPGSTGFAYHAAKDLSPGSRLPGRLRWCKGDFATATSFSKPCGVREEESGSTSYIRTQCPRGTHHAKMRL